MSVALRKEVDCTNRRDAFLVPAWFRLLIREVHTNIEGLKKIQVTIILVDEERIKILDAYYQKRPRVTDVLSFLYEEHGTELDGEIFVCLPQAKRQASRHGVSLKKEVARLTVHGYLHLQGYDHMRVAERRDMMERTDVIMRALVREKLC